jgi:hypothetical protein
MLPVKFPMPTLILPALTFPVTFALPPVVMLAADSAPEKLATLPLMVRATFTVFDVIVLETFRFAIEFTVAGNSIIRVWADVVNVAAAGKVLPAEPIPILRVLD